MSCQTVSTLEEAKAEIPSSLLPISGLRRDENGNLSKDALQTVVDGLKSRGMNPAEKDTKKRLMDEMSVLLCSLNNQYQFLMKELQGMVNMQAPISNDFLKVMKEKNMMMMDVLNVSRHIEQLAPSDESSKFLEGWQNMADTLTQTEHTRRHMIEMTKEKNRLASNYLGLYGFLNIVAVGLLIYIAGVSNK